MRELVLKALKSIVVEILEAELPRIMAKLAEVK
jgi:hypothetical protein